MTKQSIVQLPASIEDPIIIRRVLDVIITEVDKLKGDRGGEAPATASNVLGNFESLNQLTREINILVNKFSPLDGTLPYTNVVKYNNVKTFNSNLDLVSKGYVDAKVPLTVPSPTTITTFISDPPTQIEIVEIKNKLNEVITSLKQALIFT